MSETVISTHNFENDEDVILHLQRHIFSVSMSLPTKQLQCSFHSTKHPAVTTTENA